MKSPFEKGDIGGFVARLGENPPTPPFTKVGILFADKF